LNKNIEQSILTKKSFKKFNIKIDKMPGKLKVERKCGALNMAVIEVC
jgi:hypothetical protein